MNDIKIKPIFLFVILFVGNIVGMDQNNKKRKSEAPHQSSGAVRLFKFKSEEEFRILQNTANLIHKRRENSFYQSWDSLPVFSQFNNNGYPENK